jgi:hypothetical protein
MTDWRMLDEALVMTGNAGCSPRTSRKDRCIAAAPPTRSLQNHIVSASGHLDYCRFAVVEYFRLMPVTCTEAT